MSIIELQCIFYKTFKNSQDLSMCKKSQAGLPYVFMVIWENFLAGVCFVFGSNSVCFCTPSTLIGCKKNETKQGSQYPIH